MCEGHVQNQKILACDYGVIAVKGHTYAVMVCHVWCHLLCMSRMVSSPVYVTYGIISCVCHVWCRLLCMSRVVSSPVYVTYGVVSCVCHVWCRLLCMSRMVSSPVYVTYGVVSCVCHVWCRLMCMSQAVVSRLMVMSSHHVYWVSGPFSLLGSITYCAICNEEYTHVVIICEGHTWCRHL